MSSPQKYVTRIELPDNMYIDRKRFQKIIFITNAIEGGWMVKKRGNSYVFSKKHDGIGEVMSEEYLKTFVETMGNSGNIELL
jgi:hypothetical protein